ncbi:WD repeat-containing protein 6-like [Macrosteles quadrilineatus]|uniref:WD repeat-containing protein 6-like n=1 Tax=Macrosteles quadrilineatus TaxID=74068 RepID=UPI0023E0AFDD|nr:WD repeat-containing protein 6-like [Macrosteles quadrilineatus]
MTNFKFYSRNNKIAVTSVIFYETYILAGIGGDLCVYEQKKKNDIYSIFHGSVIHGIVPNLKSTQLCVHGGRQVGIIKTNLKMTSDKRLSVVCKWRLADWVLSCQWVGLEHYLAVLTAHNVLSLHDTSTGVPLSTVNCVENCILYSAAVLQNANRWEDTVVLAGTVFQQIVIWTVGNESPSVRPVLHKLCGHKGVIFSVRYNAQSSQICSTSDDRTVRVWSVASSTDKPLTAQDWKEATITLTVTIFGHMSRVWQSCILTDKRIVSIGEDSMLCVWAGGGESISRRETHQGAGIWCMHVTDDESLVVTGGADGGVTLWPLDPPSTTTKTLPPPPDTARRVALLPGQVVTVTEEGRLMVYKEDWRCVLHDPRIASYCLLDVSPSRKRIGLATIKGYVIVLDSEHFEVILDKQVSETKIFSLHWLDEKTLLTCHDLGQMFVWSIIESGLLEVGRCYLPACKERWTTAAVRLRDTIVYGDRAGNIHSSPVLPTHACTVEAVTTVHRAHSRLGVSSLSVVQGEVWSTGRDGMLRRFSVRQTDHSLVCVAASKLQLDWAASVLCVSPQNILVLCFHESQVVLWDVQRRHKLLSLQCGGGHRSWDCLVEDGHFTFVFLKNKTAHLLQSELMPIERPVLLEGFHPREINSMAHITEGWVVSGGEDGTVRLSQSCNKEWTTCAVEHNHLSSVRAVSVAKVQNQIYLFSAGGRAQMKVWKIRLAQQVCLAEVTSVMLREERKDKHWLNVVPISDPETRYMDLAVLPESDSSAYVLVACSDAYLRVFYFDSKLGEVSLFQTVENGCCCLLRVSWFQHDSLTVVVTAATDGCVTFWQWPECAVVCEDTVHQSGVNGLSVLCEDGRVVVATGGDDNCVAVSVYDVAASPTPSLRKVDGWSNSTLHSSVVTGVTIVGDKIVCCAGDQRVTLLSWRIIEDCVNVQILAQYCCSIPDLKGLTLLAIDRQNLTLAVYGDGMEVLEIKEES